MSTEIIKPKLFGEPVNFLAARADRDPEPVEGFRVHDPLPDWAQWAVYYRPEYYRWYVIELLSGWAVAKAYQSDVAIESALEKLMEVGREIFFKRLTEVPVINPQFGPVKERDRK